MPVHKLAYPSPPPTTNTLTPLQRAQLLRSAKKLSKVLGTTPRLIDSLGSYEPISIELPLSPGAFEGKRSLDSEALSDTSDSTSSNCSPTSLTTFFPSASYDTLAPSPIQSSSPASNPPSLKQPSLRISVPRADEIFTTPRTLSRSLSSSSSISSSSSRSSYRHYRRKSIDGNDSSIFNSTINEEKESTFPPAEPIQVPLSPLFSPTFNIPTTSSLRMQKMDRVRRKLGDDVPPGLVFPHASLKLEKPLPDAPSHPSQQSQSLPEVKTTMVIEVKTSVQKHKIRRVPVPKWDPSTESDIEPERKSSDDKTQPPTNKRLSVVLECPDT